MAPSIAQPRPMRRADREVTSPEEIEEILRACDDVCIAYQDAQGLTIVPVNFAYVTDFAQRPHRLRLFAHSALEGRKVDAIRAAGNALPVAFEMDCDARIYTGRTPYATMTAFRSIIGTGTASLVEETGEKIDVLELLLAQCAAMPDARLLPRQVDKVAVWRIDSTDFTAKHHPAPAMHRE